MKRVLAETDAPLGVVGLMFPEGWPEPEIAWSLFDAAEGRGIALDSSGDVYVAGSFSTTAAFGSLSVTSAGKSDAFVAKVDGTTQSWSWVLDAGGIGEDLALGP